MATMGVDIGGTGVKAAAFSEEGRLLALEYREYAPITAAPGQFELDPREILRAAKECIARAAQKAGEEVLAIGFSSMGECFVCLDKQDNILANCITYHDQRGKDLYEEFIRRFGEHEILGVLGGARPNYVQSLHRLRLMVRANPDAIRKTERICLLADFIAYMLGGQHIADYSLCYTTGCFDPAKKDWHRAYVEWAGLCPGMFPTPVPTGTCAGTVSQKAAAELGVKTSTKLVVGPNDQLAASIGADAHRSGELFNIIGTADVLRTFGDAAQAKRAYEKGMAYFMHDYDGIYNINPGPNYSGASVLKWFRDRFGRLENSAYKAEGKDFYTEYEKRLPKAPTRLLVMSHFSGTADDPAAKGAILNLQLDTKNEEIYRAFMEGASYTIRGRIEEIRAAGLPADTVKTIGGGAKSAAFMQIRADVFGVPVTTPRLPEAGVFGCALLAGRAAGMYGDLKEVAGALVQTGRVFEPNMKNYSYYNEQYQKYLQAKEALRMFAEQE
ncbi:MAG: FGGY-family carbohydrate kinase [Christensenellaceae bacterium]|jgi:xylulokinase